MPRIPDSRLPQTIGGRLLYSVRSLAASGGQGYHRGGPHGGDEKNPAGIRPRQGRLSPLPSGGSLRTHRELRSVFDFDFLKGRTMVVGWISASFPMSP